MTITIDPRDWQKVLAEVVGTFFYFFIGIASIPVANSQGLIYAALAHGVALAIAISALGHISGGHFNPAVSIGLALARKISPVLALLYIIGQLLGGVMACLALVLILPQNVWSAFQLGTPSVNTQVINMGQAILLEALLTFFLVVAIFGTAVDLRAPRIGGFGTGLTLFVGIVVGGPLTGGIMNPARAISPAIVSGNWRTDQLVYWVGPILGAAVASLLYSVVFLPKGDEPVVVAPLVADRPMEPPASQPALVHDMRDVVAEDHAAGTGSRQA
jgi:MIP family channel proteins